jgi:hypothetical protein
MPRKPGTAAHAANYDRLVRQTDTPEAAGALRSPDNPIGFPWNQDASGVRSGAIDEAVIPPFEAHHRA